MLSSSFSYFILCSPELPLSQLKRGGRQAGVQPTSAFRPISAGPCSMALPSAPALSGVILGGRPNFLGLSIRGIDMRPNPGTPNLFIYWLFNTICKTWKKDI